MPGLNEIAAHEAGQLVEMVIAVAGAGGVVKLAAKDY
jgi:hypothetical protein